MSDRASTEAGAPARCPCGSGLPHDRCCGPVLRGDREAPTAEALMRARYSAYATRDEGYLLRSWSRSRRPRRVDFPATLVWTGLTITASTGGALLDTEGTVTFEAHHRDERGTGVLREVSRFAREDGRWVYVGPAAISS